MHGEAIEAQYREIEKQRERFTLEIETLKEAKEDKTKNARQDAKRKKWPRESKRANRRGRNLSLEPKKQKYRLYSSKYRSKNTYKKAKLRIGSFVKANYTPPTLLDSSYKKRSQTHSHRRNRP